MNNLISLLEVVDRVSTTQLQVGGFILHILDALKAHTQVKKFQSLKLWYIALYHRKSILSFSTLHLKEICTR